MPQLAMIEAFANLPDERRTSGRRHQQPLRLALFTLGVVAGNRGWIAIGDWVKAHQAELVALFQPAKGRLPSYSTIRRAVLGLADQEYGARLARFFGIQPLPGETVTVDGKVLRGSYETISDDPTVDSHPAIVLVSAYIVERGLILAPYEVDARTNEIKALPAFIEQLALKGVVFAFDAKSERQLHRATIIEISTETRY